MLPLCLYSFGTVSHSVPPPMSVWGDAPPKRPLARDGTPTGWYNVASGQLTTARRQKRVWYRAVENGPANRNRPHCFWLHYQTEVDGTCTRFENWLSLPITRVTLRFPGLVPPRNGHGSATFRIVLLAPPTDRPTWPPSARSTISPSQPRTAAAPPPGDHCYDVFVDVSCTFRFTPSRRAKWFSITFTSSSAICWRSSPSSSASK